MNKTSLQNRFRRAAEAVDQAAQTAGRPGGVTLLAVSKTVDTDAVEALYEIGVRDFGENREPELERKSSLLPDDIKWHFIGRLQSNKIRKIIRHAAVIHSVDSAAMLQRIDRIAGEESKTPEIFIEVSIAGEEQKGGIAPAELPELISTALQCRNIKVCGLMTMAPFDAEEEELQKIFSELASLRDRLNDKYGSKILTELSMGMSGDFRTAIRCGSTIVRIGSAIFSETE